VEVIYNEETLTVDAILPIFSIYFQCGDLLVTRKRCVVCHQRNAATKPAHTTMIDTQEAQEAETLHLEGGGE